MYPLHASLPSVLGELWREEIWEHHSFMQCWLQSRQMRWLSHPAARSKERGEDKGLGYMPFHQQIHFALTLLICLKHCWEQAAPSKVPISRSCSHWSSHKIFQLVPTPLPPISNTHDSLKERVGCCCCSSTVCPPPCSFPSCLLVAGHSSKATSWWENAELCKPEPLV